MKRFSLVLLMAMLTAGGLMAQTITGTVTDQEGDPLIGATVIVVGTTVGTATDIDGKFTLLLPEGAENVLEISYTGFTSQRINVGNQTNFNITMQQGAVLDEVVITGYTAQSKRVTTFNSASVGSEVFENVSVQSLDQALQGQLPGVEISGSAGALGAGVAIRVRGTGSINASNQPIFVVDGQIFSGVSSAFGLGTSASTNPLININPDDIESVDVLKDAAAASLYGARGSNGVIVIKTKSGSYNQPARVSVNFYTGITQPTFLPELLTGPEYAELWNDAADNVGRTDKYDNPTSEPTTDWIDLVTQDGSVYDFSASVSGGDNNTKFFMSGSYRNEDSWIRRSNLTRYSFRANIEQQITDKLSTGISLSPSRTINTRQDQENSVAAPLTYAQLFFPNVPAFDDNGEVIGGVQRTSIGRGQFPSNPLGNLEGRDIPVTTSQILASPFIQYRPIPELRVRMELNSQFTQVEDRIKASSITIAGFGIGGTANASNQQTLNWTWKNLVGYSNVFGNHSIDALVNFEMQRIESTNFNIAGQTFADDRLKTLASAAEITGGSGNLTSANFVRIIGNANYGFKGKYLVGVTIVREGSSRFGVNNRYATFPAFSAGWIASDESWFNIRAINFLKLRASWGQTGNAQFGNFSARGLVSFGNDYNAVPGFVFSQLENAGLEWEKGETLDFGIEFGLFKNRVSGSLNYFIKDTKDLLLDVPLPLEIGITNASILSNVGEIRNQGLELQLDIDVLTGPLQWTIGFNASTLDNEVTKLVDNDGDGKGDDIVGGTTIIREGETVSSLFLVPYAGVDPSNGDALYVGADGELIANSVPANARQILGNSLPDFQGGFNTSLKYKNFDFSAFFQFAMGHQKYRNEAVFNEANFSATWNLRRDRAFDTWSPDNTDAQYPQRRLFQDNGTRASGRWVDDADYMRMKTLQVGYTTPAIGPSGMRIRFFFTGQNLLTITDYLGLDPEGFSFSGTGGTNLSSVFFSRPQTKTYAFGLNLNF